MNELFRQMLYLPPQASSLARSIDTLHYVVIGAAFTVATLTFLLIGYFLIRFRESGPAATPPKKFPRSAEIALASGTLTVFIAWWLVGFAQYREMRSPPEDAMRIHVIAKQWMWQFIYPDGATSEDELRVPVGQPVEVVMTSRDMIHSFYVPAFRLKQDVLPGRITSLWFTATEPGRFEILCAEYCGAGHSRMRGVVVALPPDEYARWSARHTTEDLTRTGERLAGTYGCLRCHSADGSPGVGPTWRALYGSDVELTTGRHVVADDAYLTESMMDPAVKIVAGFPPVMPSYLGLVSGADAAALLEYIRSLRGAR